MAINYGHPTFGSNESLTPLSQIAERGPWQIDSVILLTNLILETQ